MNTSLIDVCRELPGRLPDAAVLFLQDRYADFSIYGLLNFFTLYHPPAWTILYWLHAEHGALDRAELARCLRAQSMAMFLHMLDDHLVDGAVTPDHSVLQLRTLAWTIYEETVRSLEPGGAGVFERRAAEYFDAVHRPVVIVDLDGYCAAFPREMGTWKALPEIAAARVLSAEAGTRLMRAYESFGVAWRILDDLRDVAEDGAAGVRTAVYWSLPEADRSLWGTSAQAAVVERVLPDVYARMLACLRTAEEEAAAAGLRGLAQELRELNPGPAVGRQD